MKNDKLIPREILLLLYKGDQKVRMYVDGLVTINANLQIENVRLLAENTNIKSRNKTLLSLQREKKSK